jgi:hypothetical protein
MSGGGIGNTIGSIYGQLPQNMGGRSPYLGMSQGRPQTQGQYSPPSNYNYGGMGPYNTMTQDMATQQMGSGTFDQGQFSYQGAGYPGSYSPYNPYGMQQSMNPYGGGYGFNFGGGGRPRMPYQPALPPMIAGGYGGGYGGGSFGFGGQGVQQMRGRGMSQAFPNAVRSVRPAQEVQQYLNYRSPFAGGGEFTQYSPKLAGFDRMMY